MWALIHLAQDRIRYEFPGYASLIAQTERFHSRCLFGKNDYFAFM